MTLASNQVGAILYSLQINCKLISNACHQLSVMVKIIPDFGSSDSMRTLLLWHYFVNVIPDLEQDSLDRWLGLLCKK